MPRSYQQPHRFHCEHAESRQAGVNRPTRAQEAAIDIPHRDNDKTVTDCHCHSLYLCMATLLLLRLFLLPLLILHLAVAVAAFIRYCPLFCVLLESMLGNLRLIGPRAIILESAAAVKFSFDVSCLALHVALASFELRVLLDMLETEARPVVFK